MEVRLTRPSSSVWTAWPTRSISRQERGEVSRGISVYVAGRERPRSDRRRGGDPRSQRRARGAAAADRDQNKAIRDLGAAQGRNISERGRIPQSIVDEYHAAAGR